MCWYPNGYCENTCCEGESGICDRERPVQPDAQLGESCDPVEDIWCARGLYCTATVSTEPGVCALLPKHGEPCTSSCAELGDSCDSTTLRCDDASVRGEPCMDHFDCTGFYTCGSDNRCGDGYDRLRPDGSTCMYSIECYSGWCDENKLCVPYPSCY